MSLKNQLSNHFIVYLILFFFLNQISNSQSKRSSKKDILTIPESIYESLKYRSIGPHRGGRSSAVTGVPGKPNLFYFGSAGGGVWKTVDGGDTYENISDGFFGDLQKILHGKFGAKISRESIPISDIAKKFLTDNANKIKFSDILSWGDDYELLFTSFKKNRKKLLTLAKKNKVKISLVGSIINKAGIYDDSLRPVINTNSFDHFC